MPASTSQIPNIDLPGAEYFSLAPGGTIMLSGRRRMVHVSAAVVIPPTTDAVNITDSFVLESPFTPTSGIYLHRFWLTIGPALPGLVVINVFAGLSMAVAPFPDYPLGNPTLTNPTVNIGTILLSDRDILVSAKDILAAGLAIGQTETSTLSAAVQVNVNNPEAVAISTTARVGMIYTRLDGLTE